MPAGTQRELVGGSLDGSQRRRLIDDGHEHIARHNDTRIDLHLTCYVQETSSLALACAAAVAPPTLCALCGLCLSGPGVG